eukprot:TRINITY_DN59782_c0_g1_i1.p1 TRINITY_DN59782_c0_g1~~TRINITY_DN59782_c0_g1_i1.p1  ORF type:complete len:322 (+),score=33.15 TRINITY_DN59782_c0_g1_i1:141-1106(+)
MAPLQHPGFTAARRNHFQDFSSCVRRNTSHRHHGQLVLAILVGILPLVVLDHGPIAWLLGPFWCGEKESLSEKDKELRRRGAASLLVSSMLAPSGSASALSGEVAKRCQKCCIEDWCRCRDFICDCVTELQEAGYHLPSSFTGAFGVDKPASKTARWETVAAAVEIPHWAPVAGRDLSVQNSTLPKAGQGLFAAVDLPADAVLPVYRGRALTYQDLSVQWKSRADAALAYLWCPLKTVFRMRAYRDGDSSGCLDAEDVVDGNPARYINAAASTEQCERVNVDLCELGEVLFFRALGPVAKGAELIADYGPTYWNSFGGCRQ